MEHEFRRLIPRLVVDWRGVMKLDQDPHELWRDCRVTDISSAGAALELVNTLVEEVKGDSLLLAIHMRAQVRHVGSTNDNRLRMGTEFTGLTDAERAYLASLQELEAYW